MPTVQTPNSGGGSLQVPWVRGHAGPLLTVELEQRSRGPGNRALSYIEGWLALDEANRIFGHGNWSRETVLIEPLHNPVLVTEEGHPE